MSELGELVLRLVADEMVRAWAAIRRCLGDSLGYSSVNHINFDEAKLVSGNPRVQGLLDADQVQAVVARLPTEHREVFETHHLSGLRQPWVRLGIGRSTYFRRLKQARAYVREELDKRDQ